MNTFDEPVAEPRQLQRGSCGIPLIAPPSARQGRSLRRPGRRHRSLGHAREIPSTSPSHPRPAYDCGCVARLHIGQEERRRNWHTHAGGSQCYLFFG